MNGPAPYELRPLDLGEVLDRTVTLCVRHFGSIVAVIAVALVPLTLLGAAIASIRASATIGIPRALGSVSLGSNLFQALVELILWGALVAMLAEAYRGSGLTVLAAYGLGIRRWWPQAIVSAIYLGSTAIAFIPGVLLIIGAFNAVALRSPGASATGAMQTASVIGLAIFAIGVSWIYIAYRVAAVAVVTESFGPWRATVIGFRRTFAAGVRLRTFAAGLIVLALSAAGAFGASAIEAYVTRVTHVAYAGFAAGALGHVLVMAVVAAFMVVYAFDLRVRREGLDLV